MKFIKNKMFFEELLIYLLIATLPFYFLRFFDLSLSITHFLCIVVVSTSLVKMILKKNACLSIGYFEWSVVLYCIIPILWIAIQPSKEGVYVWLKTLFYLIFFFSFKSLVNHIGVERSFLVISKGISSGILSFFTISMIVVVTSDLLASVVSFDYWGFGYRFFNEFNLLISGRDFEEASQVMRNAMGEIFVFFAAFQILFHRGNRINTLSIALSVTAMAITFSRRAFLAFVLIFMIYSIVNLSGGFRKDSIIKISIGFILLIGLIFTSIETSSRLVEFRSDDRMLQYSEAIASMTSRDVIWGVGYAEKVGKTYVHNLILASLYMLGIIGLITSVLVYLSLLSLFFKRLVRNKYKTVKIELTLIIPLVGVMVGSTVEGLFTIIGWIVIGLVISASKFNNFSKINDSKFG